MKTEERDLETTRAWVNERSLATQLRVKCTEMERGRAVTLFDPPPEWRNPNDSVPGAMIAAFADHAAGYAAISAIGPDDYTVTVDLDVRFIRAAFHTPIKSEAVVVRRGRRLAFIKMEMWEADGTLVADGTASFFIETRLGKAHPIGRDE